jgi:hypothetical protein
MGLVVCWDCDGLGLGVSVTSICKGMTPCMFVGLESVDYLVYIIVMSILWFMQKMCNLDWDVLMARRCFPQ